MTKTARSFRLSGMAERQLAALAAHWGASLTETLTLCIDRAWRAESWAPDPPPVAQEQPAPEAPAPRT